MKKHLTIVGLRMVKELRGEPCLELEEVTPKKQKICTSRSFGAPVAALEGLAEAVANYASKCAYKLRKQASCASVVTVFVMTNRYANSVQYSNSKTIQMPSPVNSDLHLIQYASMALRSIYREGYSFKKVGVIVSDFVPEDNLQLGLFDGADTGKHKDLMKALDTLNSRYGRSTVKAAALGTVNTWTLKREKLSPCYTTRLSDVLIARL